MEVLVGFRSYCQYQKPILQLLHESHIGIPHIKSFARLHIWWPLLDADIELFAKVCVKCAESAKELRI